MYRNLDPFVHLHTFFHDSKFHQIERSRAEPGPYISALAAIQLFSLLLTKPSCQKIPKCMAICNAAKIDWMVIEKVIHILKSDFLVYVLNFFSMSKDGLDSATLVLMKSLIAQAFLLYAFEKTQP